jgi:glycosyltransferase involved in cell wall biosynthesis
MQNKISVILITGNEERHLKNCLESVKWADEIIVVDSESEDNSVEIARKYTDKVFVKKWEGFGPQYKFALQQASNEWIFNIDTDERVTENLVEVIMNVDTRNIDGYFIKRENYFLGRKINSCGWEKDYQLRFFRKSRAKVIGESGHESYVVDGDIEQLEEPFLHYTYETIQEALMKTNRYSVLNAKVKYGNGKRYGLGRIIFQPMIAFYHFYFARKGFRDGVFGFLVSLLHSLTILQVNTIVWELEKKAE